MPALPCCVVVRDVSCLTRLPRMAARGLLWFVCIHILVSCVLCGRARQQQSPGHAQPEQPTALHSSHECEAVLLSSLSTFVTSGSGYAYQAPLRRPQPSGQVLGSRAATTNSSSTAGSNLTLDPTPPHKPLWPDWSSRDVWLFSLATITLFIAGECRLNCSAYPQPRANLHERANDVIDTPAVDSAVTKHEASGKRIVQLCLLASLDPQLALAAAQPPAGAMLLLLLTEPLLSLTPAL